MLDENPGVSRTLANQLLRSGTSIGANLEESKGGQNHADKDIGAMTKKHNKFLKELGLSTLP